MTEQKQPQAGEWWIADDGSICYIVGVKRNGHVIFEGPCGGHFNGDADWNDWHHEPLCTGFDWQPEPAEDKPPIYTCKTCGEFHARGSKCDFEPEQPPAPIDPGKGWELLPVGTVLQDGDEYLDFFGVWTETQQAGDCICDNKTMKTYRRRKSTAEVWPKWYRWSDESLTFAFSRLADGTVFTHQSGVPTLQSDDWHVSLQGALKAGNLIEVTESEALARVKPAEPIDPGEGWELLVKPCMLQEGDQSWNLGKWIDTHFAGTMYSGDDENIYRRRKPPAETWPKYYVHSDADRDWYVQRFKDDRCRVYRVTGVEDQLWIAMYDGHVSNGIWIEVTESEAKSRVKPAEPIAAERIPDNRPARDVIEDIVSRLDCVEFNEMVINARDAAQQWLEDNPEDSSPFAKPFTDARSGMGIRKEQAVERTATPLVTAAVESPDDWVTQDRVPARPGIDDRRYHYSDGTASDWDDSASIHWDRPVRHGDKIGATTSSFVELRCRRRDLPAPQPKRTPVRLYWYDGNIVGRYDHSPPTDPSFQEIKFDGSGFYVTEGE